MRPSARYVGRGRSPQHASQESRHETPADCRSTGRRPLWPRPRRRAVPIGPSAAAKRPAGQGVCAAGRGEDCRRHPPGRRLLAGRPERRRLLGIGRAHKGAEHLCRGSWRPHGFLAAVTSLCISALLEGQDDRPEVAQAIDRGEWLFENLPGVRRASSDTMYNNWAHGYAIQALVKMLERRPDDAKRQGRSAELIESQIDMLSALRVRRRRLVLLRFRRPHAEAQRLDDQLRHGHRAGGPGRGPLHRRPAAAAADRPGDRPRSGASASPTSATATASTSRCGRCTRSTGRAEAWAARRPATWPCACGATAR